MASPGFFTASDRRSFNKIAKDVKLTFFSDNIQQADIACSVIDSTVVATAPATLNPAHPVKVFTHGFTPVPFKYFRREFAQRWHLAYGGQVNTILVKWCALATTFQVNLKEFNAAYDTAAQSALATAFQVNLKEFNAAYDTAAQNAMEVGTVVGACLWALFQQQGIPLKNLYLVGHSLGAHAMGQAGRTIALLSQGDILHNSPTTSPLA